jgi:hypothetical protein
MKKAEMVCNDKKGTAHGNRCPDAASTSGAGMKPAPTKPRADPVSPPPGCSNEGVVDFPPLPFQWPRLSDIKENHEARAQVESAISRKGGAVMRLPVYPHEVKNGHILGIGVVNMEPEQWISWIEFEGSGALPLLNWARMSVDDLHSEMEMAHTFRVGDHVTWNSEAGYVSGTIIKVHLRNTEYKGYIHHASPKSPQYEIKSDKTDHIALHKSSALKLAK